MEERLLKRGLINIGGTYYINIPIGWLRKFNFKPSDYFVLQFDNNKVIITKLNEEQAIDKMIR
jgi:broad specificity phosphatase PhoE